MTSPLVIEHFNHPRNAGPLPGATAVGRAENGGCGDLAEVSLAIEHGIIVQARFQAQACAATIACCSRLTELVTGLSPSEALRGIDRERLERELGGLPATSGHAAEVAVRALKAALAAGAPR